MTRTYKGHRKWTAHERQRACQYLRQKGWDGTTENLASEWVATIASEFGIPADRAEAQLGRQLKAAIVRGRKEKWAQAWREAWETMTSEQSKQAQLEPTPLDV
jgi:hypothetical protein